MMVLAAPRFGHTVRRDHCGPKPPRAFRPQAGM